MTGLEFTGGGGGVPAFSVGRRLPLPTDTLGGSWVVISRVLNPLTWVLTFVTLLTTPLITTHEPPSSS